MTTPAHDPRLEDHDEDFISAVEAEGRRLSGPRPPKGNGGSAAPKLTEAELAKILVLETLKPMTAVEIVEEDLPDPEPIVKGLLLPDTVLVVGGLVKVRKSWLLLQLALSIAAGIPFLGHEVPAKRRVLLLSAEGSKRNFRKRLMLALATFDGLQDEDLENFSALSTMGRVKIDTQAGEDWLTRTVEGFDVVCIDPYYRFLSIGSENLHEDQRAVQDAMDRLKARGKAIIIAHHLRKPQGTDAGAAELRGAGLDAFLDSGLILSRKKTRQSERFTLRYILRHDEEPDDLELEPNGPLLKVAEPIERIVTGADVASVLADAGGRVDGRQPIVEAIRRLTGASDTSARRAIQEAETKGIIGSAKRIGQGQGRTYFLREDAT